MEIGRSFSYQFDDSQWITKLGLAALISLVPILNFSLIGYMVGIVRNVATGAAEPLPNWDNFGQKFRDGLILTVAWLIYSLPGLLLICLPLGLLAASGVFTQDNRLAPFGRWALGAGWVAYVGIMVFLLIYLLMVSILQPVILVMFSREGKIASCFRLREAVDILRRHLGAFSATWLATVITGLLVGLIVAFVNLVVGWIPCVGWLVGSLLAIGSTVYIVTTDAHLLGRFRLAAFGGQASNPAVSTAS